MFEDSILILGSGLVCAPCVGYLLKKNSENPKFSLTICTNEMKEAEELVKLDLNFGTEKAKIRHVEQCNIRLTEELDVGLIALMRSCRVVISLLPYAYHLQIAKACLKTKTHFVTASYQTDAILEFHNEVVEKNLTFLNEVGLDPGIDHLQAMSMIDRVKEEGYEIDEFSSVCGGLPESKDLKYLRYKFSWSPRGFFLASKNSAKFKCNNEVHEIPGDKIMDNVKNYDEFEDLEVLPNRDSLKYEDIYGISAKSFFRGTLRYRGFSKYFKFFVHNNLLCDDQQVEHTELTPKEHTLKLIKKFGGKDESDLTKDEIQFLEHYEFLADSPKALFLGTPLQYCVDVFTKNVNNWYSPDERDAVFMSTKLICRKGNDRRTFSAKLNISGDPQNSAMSKTVGLTAGAAAQLILERQIPRGVLRPTNKLVYTYLIDELEAFGVKMEIE